MLLSAQLLYREVKEKLVAYQGKLINVKEPLGELPNGTAFTITLQQAPELDATQLPIGQVSSILAALRSGLTQSGHST